MMGRLALLLLPAATRAFSSWSSCTFPSVDWILTDIGDGKSATQKVIGMGPDAYISGYTVGTQTLVTSTAEFGITRVDDESSTLDLHISKVNSAGEPTNIWIIKSLTPDVCQPPYGYGKCSTSDMHKFPDLTHLALSGYFVGNMSFPGGTVISNPFEDQIYFVTKFNTDAGEPAWVKTFEDHSVPTAVDGDGNGHMWLLNRDVNMTYHILRLRSNNGNEMTRITMPAGVSLGLLRIGTDGGGYAAGTIEGTDLAIGGLTNVSSSVVDGEAVSSPLLLKWNSNGIMQWAKVFGQGDSGDMDLSFDNSKLVLVFFNSMDTTVDGITLTGRSGLETTVASFDPADGTMLWAANMPYLRGVEITDDSEHVVCFGQTAGDTVAYALEDAVGGTSTVRSRGSYDVFVAKLSAADGSGIWALDGGGDGMEYFWGFGMDANSNILVSGYSRSSQLIFGDASMHNPTHVDAGGDGANTIYTIRLSTMDSGSLPSCLDACTDPLVPTTGCFIDNQCVEEGAYSPYGGHECFHCQSSSDAISWTGPDVSEHCFIDGICYANGQYEEIPHPDPGYAAYGYTVESPCRRCDVASDTDGWSVDPMYHYSEASGCSGAYTSVGAGACRGNGGDLDKVNARHHNGFTDEGCRAACDNDAAFASGEVCTGYAIEISGDQECILYGPGMAGFCATDSAVITQAECEAIGTCANNEAADSEDKCGSCSDSSAAQVSSCSAVGGTWTAGTWTATGVWEMSADPWTPESYHTDHVHTFSANVNYECYDKDVTDHVGKCSGTDATPYGTDCAATYAAADTYAEASCPTAAPENCVWTDAIVSPTVKVPHPTAVTVAGYDFHSGACRSTSSVNAADSDATNDMNDRPPYIYTSNPDFPELPSPFGLSELATLCNTFNTLHAADPVTNPAQCLGFHSGPWVSIFGMGMDQDGPHLTAAPTDYGWFGDAGNPDTTDLTGTKVNHQYVCYIRDAEYEEPAAEPAAELANEDDDDGMSDGEVAGVAVGCLLAGVIIGALVCVVTKNASPPRSKEMTGIEVAKSSTTG